MDLNVWKEKDESEQRYLIYGQLVLANDWLRQVAMAAKGGRGAGDVPQPGKGVPSAEDGGGYGDDTGGDTGGSGMAVRPGIG